MFNPPWGGFSDPFQVHVLGTFIAVESNALHRTFINRMMSFVFTEDGFLINSMQMLVIGS